MTDFLIKLFIGADADPENPSVRRKYGFLSGCAGIVINIFLFVLKIITGLTSGAISITADALNNLSDAGSSIVNMVGFKIALTPPDKEHPFGHGRAEYISGLIISFIIALMGVELAKSSIEKILFPSSPKFDIFTVIVLVLSVLLKLWMFFFNRKLGRKISSVSMKATAMDSISDVTATSAVLLGIAVTKLTNLNIDGYIGLIVSLFIIFSGIKTAKESLSPLLGQMPDKELVQKIKNTVCSFEGIIGIHDLIVHNYGVGMSIISLHAEIPSHMSLSEAHALIDKAESEIQRQFNCNATIHIDPVNVNDSRYTYFIEHVTFLIKTIDPSLSLHDFRLLGNTVAFDLVVPYKSSINKEQLRKSVVQGIKAIDENVIPIINIERQMTELD